MTKNSSFLKWIALLFIILSGIIIVLNYLEYGVVHSLIWVIQTFFLFLTLAAHFIASKGLKDKKDFPVFYTLSMTIRLLCCLAFVLIILFTSDNKFVFIANFFILYLAYTSLEIYFLLRNLRADLKSDA